MSGSMARTRDWNCLKHITWTINREYQAIWRLPELETSKVRGLKKHASIGSGSFQQTAAPFAASSSGYRGFAKGAYNHHDDDGAEEVTGAGKATPAAKSDAVGEEMRVDSFIKVDNVPQTDGDGLIEKAKKGMKKVGEKMKDASDYMRAGADKAEDKEGSKSTSQQVMDRGANVVDATADTVKEAASGKDS
ncbi:hypothetical protein R1sor_009939 [Riccia sorocarpa]|uniref:Uncharacterized protein n=1 Tax=Riccia sorocarpa TaxID=122646 RepID=A0ABD3HWN6_9MARC